MKVIPTATTTKREIGKNNGNVQSYPLGLGEMPNDSVSFSGALSSGADSLKNGVTSSLKRIKELGFIAEFLVIDTISMIVPRILVGLDRDRDKTGKLNIKAGAEEAGREVVSGPSMFFIPMSIAYGLRLLAPASKLAAKPLGAMSDLMTDTIKGAKDTSSLSKEALDKEFAGKLFDKATEGFKFSDDNKLSESIFTDLKERFVKLFTNQPEKPSLKTRFVNLITTKEKDARKKASEEFTELVTEIHNKNMVNDSPVVDIHSVCIGEKDGKKIAVQAGELFDNFGDYSKDLIAKATDKDLAKLSLEECKNEMTKLLSKGTRDRNLLRLATGVTAFLALGKFLLELPKLYQQGKLSPAEESAKRANIEKIKKGEANEN